MALFERLKIDWLVLRNAGGTQYVKIDRRATFGLPVAMIDRPAAVSPSVETVDQALEWLTAC